MTSLGLVLMMIALLIGAGAQAAFAAQPLIGASITCDVDNSQINWTASSSDPSPDGGTADGAVTVIAEVDTGSQIRVIQLTSGEFNAGNGYSMGGAYTPPIEGGFSFRIIVEVDIFNDGSGEDSMVSTDWTFTDCKDGTTTTTAPTTTTTLPVTDEAQVSASCVVGQGDVAGYPITVTVTGDEGATGTVVINGGLPIPYVIDADGSVDVQGQGQAGSNSIVVTDDVSGEVLNTNINLTDCTPTTTTEAPTTSSTLAGTTSTTSSSGGSTTTDASVLTEEIDQEALPQTGLDNGPLGGIGLALIVGGAGLLMATRRPEGASSL